MSAMQQTESEDPAPRRRTRKLAVARHAQGADAIGWILLGFVMGAGAAIAVLMNADFTGRMPEAGYGVRLALPRRLEAQTIRQPAIIVQSSPLAQTLIPAIVAPIKEPALASGAPTLARGTPARTSAKAPAKPAPSGAASQVSEDAAATGLTSHTDSRPSDLF